MIGFLKDIIYKVSSYLKAKFGPKVSFKEYSKRIFICSDCVWNVEKGKRNYCKECGCPKTFFWPDSELKTKCFFKNTECPRKKW
jgi:hypothetical protein